MAGVLSAIDMQDLAVVGTNPGQRWQRSSRP